MNTNCKIKKYNQHIYIAGDKNNFSKTDHDATFMFIYYKFCWCKAIIYKGLGLIVQL